MFLFLSSCCRLWTPIDGEFDDYIVNPKPSGYQVISFHIIQCKSMKYFHCDCPYVLTPVILHAASPLLLLLSLPSSAPTAVNHHYHHFLAPLLPLSSLPLPSNSRRSCHHHHRHHHQYYYTYHHHHHVIAIVPMRVLWFFYK